MSSLGIANGCFGFIASTSILHLIGSYYNLVQSADFALVTVAIASILGIVFIFKGISES